MRQQVKSWRAQELSATAAKVTIYRAFIEGYLEVPRQNSHVSPTIRVLGDNDSGPSILSLSC